MEKFRGKYRIESTRLQAWDYGWKGSYFITICTKNRVKYFGEIVDGRMQYSNTGAIADVLWYEIKNHSHDVEFGEFVVMPNHIHAILTLTAYKPDAAITAMKTTTIITTDDINSGNDSMEPEIDEIETRGTGIVGSDNGLDDIDFINTDNVETRHALSLQSPNHQSPNHQPTNQQPSSPDLPGNHRFQNQGKNTVSSIIGGYKSAVSKHAHRIGFEFQWQERFWDHVIRDAGEFERINRYIRNNPSNWKNDKFNG
jgi:putative transposase